MKKMRCIWGIALMTLTMLAACSAYAGGKRSPAKAANQLQKADESTALVSFVRRNVLLGDAWNYDIWDGSKYVGMLGAGKLLQYRALPGEHVFMVMARGAHEWNFLKADILVGKEYFIKANPIPFHLGAGDARTEDRIDEWLAMKTSKELSEKQRSAVEKKNGKEAVAALAALEAGEVPPDCALWHPGYKRGDKHVHLTLSTSTCAAVGELKPEFGR